VERQAVVIGAPSRRDEPSRPPALNLCPEREDLAHRLPSVL
jgi:hypothetical protein